ncbi:tetratricopeptide repeat protein [Kribbella sp. CA-245084]|uniref:tetratricopeptide repeat protein n=1 Tax=Kribbella sp. CA-245084 TaxID=3239940 RepID=UPI003D8DC622
MGKLRRSGWRVAACLTALLFLVGICVAVVGNWATANQPRWLDSLLDKHQAAVWIGLAVLAVGGSIVSLLAFRASLDRESSADAGLSGTLGCAGQSKDAVPPTKPDAKSARAAGVVLAVPALSQTSTDSITGRDAELDLVLHLLDPADSVGDTVFPLVAGLPGVGKTSFAHRAASMAVERGWFADRAFFSDLHGYDADGGITAEQLYPLLLRALGVAGDQIPPTVGEQALTYSQVLVRLASDGLAVLLVFDNVSSVRQIVDLLPSGGVHRVLVTSRDSLDDLPRVRVLDLGTLERRHAVAVIGDVLLRRNPTDRRVVDEPTQASELAALCGELPLALQIAASLLADDPDLTIAALVEDLSDLSTRLDGLAYGERGVAAAFELSWQRLVSRDTRASSLFLELSINPGPEIGLPAAAALHNESQSVVRRQLRTLRRARLIEPGTAAGRWTMHDLLRAYAKSLLTVEEDPEEQSAATERLLDYYLAMTIAAGRLGFAPGKPQSDQVLDHTDALVWLDMERPNLVAAVDLAADTNQPERAWKLAVSLSDVLLRSRHFGDAIRVATTGVQAARLGTPGDQIPEAMALGNLAAALRATRQFEHSVKVGRQAIEIAREAGEEHVEGIALNNLGLALRSLRRFHEAVAAHDQAVARLRDSPDRRSTAMALSNLAAALREAGQNGRAIEVLEQSVVISRELGDRRGEAKALNNLGLVLQELPAGDVPQTTVVADAISAHEQAAQIYREVEDGYGEATARDNLGLALQRAERYADAVTVHQQALDFFRQTDDRHDEATALNNLGGALLQDDRVDQAITALEEAVRMYRNTRDAHGEGSALANLGSGYEASDRAQDARQAWTQAVEAFNRAGASEAAQLVQRLLDDD